MKVQEFRDEIDATFTTIRDRHACVGVVEKVRWLDRARRQIDAIRKTPIHPRANKDDVRRYWLAVNDLVAATTAVEARLIAEGVPDAEIGVAS